ncbi:MAG: ABC-type transport auxiliary lipoprotein family protein [Alphaproteobacteria bacterium]
MGAFMRRELMKVKDGQADRQAGLVTRARVMVALIAMVAGLAGCAALPGIPNTIYDLTAPADFRVSSGTRAQILVPEPSATKSLNNERIAARPDAVRYAYLSKAVWSDTLPKLLQARLLETLQNTGRVRAVGLPGQGLLIDYQIVLDIRAFEISGPVAVVTFSANLMNDRNGRVIATRLVSAESVIAGNSSDEAVAALDAAMDSALIELTRWVLRRI